MKKALTFDDGKPPLANLPWHGLRAVARVQLYGKRKYGDYYNYKKGLEASRNASCAVRHIAEWMDREDLDLESGENHLAHACCRLLFLLENIHDNKLIDDRYKEEENGKRRTKGRPVSKDAVRSGGRHAQK
jgi:hypothetical protein